MEYMKANETVMKYTLFTLFAICILAAGCQKEVSFVRLDDAPGDIWASMEAQQPGPQRFQISATAPTTLRGQKGTKLMLPANAFVTAAGRPVTGNVDIELKEIYEVWEMVVNNKFTQVYDTPIESGGQIFVRATQSGQELQLAPGVTLQAALPATDTLPDMQVFTGMQVDTADRSFFNWQLAANPAANNVVVNTDSIGTQQYLMQFGMLGWINCDRFLGMPLHEAKVNISNALPNETVNVIVHFDGMKSVMRLWQDNGFFMCMVPERPVTFIAIAKRSGKTYAAFHSVVAQPFATHTLKLEPTTDEAFGEKLKSLN